MQINGVRAHLRDAIKGEDLAALVVIIIIVCWRAFTRAPAGLETRGLRGNALSAKATRCPWCAGEVEPVRWIWERTSHALASRDLQ